MMRRLVGGFLPMLCIVAGVGSVPGAAMACGGAFDVVCNIGDTAKKAVNDTANAGQKAVSDATAAGAKALGDVGNAGQRAGEDTTKALQKALKDVEATANKAIQDTANSGRKAVDDTVRNAGKAVVDVVDAGKAVARFEERQTKGLGSSLSDAEKRVREGKVVDAMWHFSTDNLNHTDQDAAAAAQESEVLNAAAQGAASFYGGPAGAAAYAAWYAYHATGRVDLALKAGLLAGATSAGYTNVGSMPAASLSEVAKKAAVTGAMGGLAVAAAGGDDAAVREAFIKQGSMVLIQSAQAYANKNYIDPAQAKADAFCVSKTGVSCSYVAHQLRRLQSGDYDLTDGKPVFDTSTVLDSRKDLGQWKAEAEVAEGTFLHNAVTTGDGQWAISWDRTAFTDKSAALPAIALTYVGEGSFVKDRLDALQDAEDASSIPPPLGGATAAPAALWTAADNLGGGGDHFEVIIPKDPPGEIGVGYVLRALDDLELQQAPANGSAAPGLLQKGVTVIVSDIEKRGSTAKGQQTWVRVQPIDPNIRIDKISEPVAAPLPLPPPSVSTPKPPSGKIWCFDRESHVGFQIDEKLNVSGLITKLAGKATKGVGGTYRVRYAQDDIVLPGIQIPIIEHVSSAIDANGTLSKRDGDDGRMRNVGTCAGVTASLQ